jgi:hypothetical protein
MVTISLNSDPEGATIIDEATGAKRGQTPREFDVAGGREARTFVLQLSGYVDKGIELVPAERVITYTALLTKRTGARA